MNQTASSRQEADRLASKGWLKSLFARPEIGPIGVMLLLFGMLGYFSIPAGEFSLNPFAGEGFNALGIRNNLRVIAQLGIIALGAGLLIIAGEFDLSIGSMIGFAGACMAMVLRWGFAIVLPYVSFEGGIHIEFFTLIYIENVSPIGAILITLVLHPVFRVAPGLYRRALRPAVLHRHPWRSVLPSRSDRGVASRFQPSPRPDEGRDNGDRASRHQEHYRRSRSWRDGTRRGEGASRSRSHGDPEGCSGGYGCVTDRAASIHRSACRRRENRNHGNEGCQTS